MKITLVVLILALATSLSANGMIGMRNNGEVTIVKFTITPYGDNKSQNKLLEPMLPGKSILVSGMPPNRYLLEAAAIDNTVYQKWVDVTKSTKPMWMNHVYPNLSEFTLVYAPPEKQVEMTCSTGSNSSYLFLVLITIALVLGKRSKHETRAS